MMAALAPIVGVFALLGLPLFAVFGAMTLLYALALDQDVAVISLNLYGQLTRSPTLVSVPLFTFAGYLMAESRTGERLVRLFDAWFGWMPGGLSVVCLLACAFFTTFTGASGVTIIAVGGLLYPVLLKQAYPQKFSLGLVTASGSLGLLFPPSLPIILYGIAAGADIQRLFVAGIVPGIALIAILAVYCIVVAYRAKVPRTPFVLRPALRALRGAFWEAILPAVIFGLMYSSVISVNETATVAALYVLIVECFVYRDLSLRRDLPRVVRESMIMVGAIFLILAVAVSFTDALIADDVPERLFQFVKQYISSPWTFLLVLNLFLLVVGCLMDIFSAIFVVVPLIVPVAMGFGIDPTHLGIIFLANLEIGYLTPPVGINLFLSSMRFQRPVVELYRVSLPFLGIMLIALALITYVPKLSTWLPDALGIRARAAEAAAKPKKTPGAGAPNWPREGPEETKAPPATTKATPGTPSADGGLAPKKADEDDDGMDAGDSDDVEVAPSPAPSSSAPPGTPAKGQPTPSAQDAEDKEEETLE